MATSVGVRASRQGEARSRERRLAARLLRVLSTVLVEHPWLTTAALLVLVVLGPLVGAVLLGRPRTTTALLVLAVLVVVVLTLSPTSREMTVTCVAEWSLPRLGAVETAANLILFAPLTLLGGVLTARPWRVALVASAASAVIELGQALLPMLGRACSTNDWWFNTLGAVLGALLAVGAIALQRAGWAPALTRGRADS